ncbi:hypothetical protein SAMN04487982_105387 [Streptomyces sp. ok210]|nr:hypothetical protein SAMN04487982_105387 [Streptomyces sp. ok210]
MTVGPSACVAPGRGVVRGGVPLSRGRGSVLNRRTGSGCPVRRRSPGGWWSGAPQTTNVRVRRRGSSGPCSSSCGAPARPRTGRCASAARWAFRIRPARRLLVTTSGGGGGYDHRVADASDARVGPCRGVRAGAGAPAGLARVAGFRASPEETPRRGTAHPTTGQGHRPPHHGAGATVPSRPGRAPKPVRRLRTEPSTRTEEGHRPPDHRAGATVPSRPGAGTQAGPALEDGPLHPDRGVRHRPPHHGAGATVPHGPGRGTQAGPALEDGTVHPDRGGAPPTRPPGRGDGALTARRGHPSPSGA